MLSKRESEIAGNRGKKQKIKHGITQSPANRWEQINFSEESFYVDETYVMHANALLKFRKVGQRGAVSRLFEIFRCFVNEALYDSVLNHLSSDDLYVQQQHSFNPNLKDFYKSLAIEIKIMGTGYSSHQPKLEDAIKEWRSYFANKFPDHPPCGQKITRVWICRFLIGPDSLDVLSNNFLSVVTKHGQYLVGDEKLFRFRGKGAPLIYEPKKPDVIGLWFYELVCLLQKNLPYCVHLRMYNKKIKTDVIPMTSVVRDWTESINAKPSNHDPILTFDSHYMSRDVVNLLISQNNLFVGSTTSTKSSELYNMCHPYVTEAGQKAGYHNEGTNQTFVLYNAGYNLGERCVLSNCHIRRKGRATPSNRVPVYDTYKAMFSGCDVFNIHLNERVWPYSRGGHGREGASGQCHSFALAVILRNTFNVYAHINGMGKDNAEEFRELCYTLADELYEFSLTV